MSGFIFLQVVFSGRNDIYHLPQKVLASDLFFGYFWPTGR